MGASVRPDPVQDYLAAKQSAAADPVADYLAAKKSASSKPILTGTSKDPETTGERVAGAISAAYQGLTLGAGDKITAGIRTVLPEKLGGVKGFDFPEALREQRQVLDEHRQRHPVESTVEELAGGLPTVAVGGAGEAANATKLGRAWQAAKAGAAYGGVSGGLDAIRPDASASDVAKASGRGAGIGAVLAPAIAPIVGKVVQGSANLARKVLPNNAAVTRVATKLGAGPATPEERAQQSLLGSLRAGGVDPEQVPIPMHSPTSAMELGSRPTQVLARQARNVPTSDAGGVIDNFLKTRAAGTGARIQDAVSGATGHVATDIEEPVESLIARRSAEARPLYEAAYEHGEIQNPETVDQIKTLLKRPVFAKAWQRGQDMLDLEGTPSSDAPMTRLFRTETGGASPGGDRNFTDDLNYAKIYRGKDISYIDVPTSHLGTKFPGQEAESASFLNAHDPTRPFQKTPNIYVLPKEIAEARQPFIEGKTSIDPAIPPGIAPEVWKTLTPKMQAQFVEATGAAAPKATGNPTVAQIDAWKKGLDAVIESGYGSDNALSKSEARLYRQKLNDVLSGVDAEVPDYAAARQSFAGHSAVMDAAEAGADHFSPKTSATYLERSLPKLSPVEQEAYRNNALNAFVQKVRNLAANPDLPASSRGVNIVQRVMGSEDAGKRLRLLFPDQASYDGFLARMEEEAKYPGTRQFVSQQSSTAAQLKADETTPGMWGDVMKAPFSKGAKLRLVGRALQAAGAVPEKGMAPRDASATARLLTLTGRPLDATIRNAVQAQAAKGAAESDLARILSRDTGIGSGAEQRRLPGPTR